MPFNTFSSSTFFDAYAANLYTAQQYNQLVAGSWTPLAQLFQDGSTAATVGTAGRSITVGLVLDRANDPATLLAGNWAERHKALAEFSNSTALWNKYGASATQYNNAVSQLQTVLGSNAPLTAATNGNLLSSAADRTIWMTLNPSEFQTLFGTTLLEVADGAGGHTLAWAGNLGLDSRISGITSLLIPQSVSVTNPALAFTKQFNPPVGPLGIGNDSADKVTATPAAIAAHYNFPLSSAIPTGAIALVEPNTYDNAAKLLAGYNTYRQALGLPQLSSDKFQLLNAGNSGNLGGELSLDISVIAGAAPNSSLLLYSTTTWSAYQRAFFDSTNHPNVLSSSFSTDGLSTAGSPFAKAFNQLMIDGLLANVTVHRSGGDSGSSSAIPNGGTNLTGDHSTPYMMIVGGTSITNLTSALTDPTVQTMLAAALKGDPGTIFPLVAAGLKTMPSHLSSTTPGPLGAATTLEHLFETVWQGLDVSQHERDRQSVLETAYGAHQTSGGGIANQVGIPSYQSSYGLSGLTGGGRGVPDVAALSGGNGHYTILNPDYVEGHSKELLGSSGGTSAAAPLWASLTAQFNAIFQDQDLPQLGFYNDLLYIASVVAPGSFSDIRLGNNITSFYSTANDIPAEYFNPLTGLYMIPTGHGFYALPGYDLVSGLGTPNGKLLARALSAVAHAEWSFSSSPPLLEDDGRGGWQSGAKEGLLLQATGHGATYHVELGTTDTIVSSGASASYAWTSRLAQQALQPDFDPALVKLFDKQAQGASLFGNVADNGALHITVDGRSGTAPQATMSNPFGFADFFGGDDSMRVARAVAIAQTVGGHNDQTAILRMRQAGEDSLQITLYKVDDLSGTIEGKAPGDAGYAAAALGRAYHTSAGLAAITGPGFGKFDQVRIDHVNASDQIAMRLDNLTTGATYWGFATANETVNGQHVSHLWSYGLNTWGWEDMYGGGDRDFNDLVVQLDFTSAYGRGWIA